MGLTDLEYNMFINAMMKMLEEGALSPEATAKTLEYKEFMQAQKKIFNTKQQAVNRFLFSI
jgi:dihydroneopterin aldolase